MERIDRLYALLERDDIDEDTKAALRWAQYSNWRGSEKDAEIQFLENRICENEI